MTTKPVTKEIYMGDTPETTAVKLGGVFVSTLDRGELANLCVKNCLQARQSAEQSQPKLVFDLNGHGLALYHSNAEYRSMLNSADIVHADGGFLITASKIFCSEPVKGRSATTDMIHDIARVCSEKKLSFYLLGGTSEVNEACVRELRQLYPMLKIVGWRNGFFRNDEQDSVIDQIAKARPDVVWVGMGKPQEQAFCIAARQRLKSGWIISCGGCYNYITGHYKRAPQWLQKLNLEWLHRLVTNPRKLFWRYLWTTPYAIWLTLRYSSKAKKSV